MCWCEPCHDRDVSVRAEAVELSGLLATSPNDGTSKKVAAVVGWALEYSDPGLRLQAMEELGRIEAKYANNYLNLALQDPNPFVRGKVLQVLDAREKQRLTPAPVNV